MLGKEYWVQSTGYSIVAKEYWVMTTGFRVLGTEYWVQNTEYSVLGTEYWVQMFIRSLGPTFKVLGTTNKYTLHGAGHKGLGTDYRILTR